MPRSSGDDECPWLAQPDGRRGMRSTGPGLLCHVLPSLIMLLWRVLVGHGLPACHTRHTPSPELRAWALIEVSRRISQYLPAWMSCGAELRCPLHWADTGCCLNNVYVIIKIRTSTTALGVEFIPVPGWDSRYSFLCTASPAPRNCMKPSMQWTWYLATSETASISVSHKTTPACKNEVINECEGSI